MGTLPQNILQSVEQTVGTQSIYTAQSKKPNEKALIAIPYTLRSGETADSVVAYHVGRNGALELVKLCRYDIQSKNMFFVGLDSELYTIGDNGVSFTDVVQSAWYYEPVSFVAARKLFEGIGDGLFAPGSAMTRAMFVTVLSRLDGADLSAYTKSPYTDTDIATWYGASVAWAAAMGIIDAGILDGCAAGTFKPNGNVTREQMAVMFANYIRISRLSLTESAAQEFADISQASTWARSAIQAMRNHGIINGMGNNLYNPKGDATRAEVTQIFTNFINAAIN